MTPKNTFHVVPSQHSWEASRAPQKGCVFLKVVVVDQSCFRQSPFPSLVPLTFEILPCGLSAQSILCPCSNDWAPSLTKHNKRDGCTTAHWPPTSPALGPHGLLFMVANLDTGIYAFLSSIVSSSLRLLCRLPAFHISEIIIRSCHISLQYLTFFFHSKSGSNCQQADLSSRRVSPSEGIFLSPSQGSQKP